MKFAVKSGDLEKQRYASLIIGVYEDGGLTPSAKRLDKLSGGYLHKLLKKGEITGKTGQTWMLYHLPHIATERVLVVGCGKNAPMSERDFRKIVLTTIKVVNTSQAEDAVVFLTELTVSNQPFSWKVKQLVEVASEAVYCFEEYKSKKESRTTLQDIIIHVEDRSQLRQAEVSLRQGKAVAEGVTYTKNLANQPSNICTPTYLANQAKLLAKKYKSLQVKILDEAAIKKLGMGAFAAVSQGSAQEARLICVEYKGSQKKQAPIALVGKGITFDTGGISLKPADSMIGMKYDMCGAATVLGTLKTAAELKLPLHLVGVIASAENMPSGTACKPEDIVTTLSGQTVEIMNTDAEGRLVLCDALTYCERYQPQVVIDIATLTGAVVIALGIHASGLLANNDKLAKALLQAGEQSFDRAWQLPLWDEYQEQIKSPFADMSNTGGRSAGTITAACFLSRFAKKFAWAHLDVAGTAALMSGGADRHATGRPVPMLVQYLLNRCEGVTHAKD